MKTPTTKEWFNEIFNTTSFILKNLKESFSLLRGKNISRSFQERLMLVVTGVKECRYCELVHSNQAEECGISNKSIEELLEGQVTNFSKEELPALKFAKKWAEKDICDFPEGEKLVEEYGTDKATEIELVLRMIRLGNLTGNSFDKFLYSITGGWLGGNE